MRTRFLCVISLVAVHFASTASFAGRSLRVNVPAIHYMGVFITNVDTARPQTVRIAYESAGNMFLSKHPEVLDPSGGFGCPTNRRCLTTSTQTLAPGETLYTGVQTTATPATPVAANTGASVVIDIAEDRGAVLATGYTQIIYITNGAVQVNSPFPILFNGGRPF